MENLDADQIPGSPSYLFRVCELNIDLPTAQAWFRDEAQAFDKNAMFVGGWAVEFDCGLQLTIVFDEAGKGGGVFATDPAPQHVARHLRHWRPHLTELSIDQHSEFINRLSDTYQELKECEAFQLWRQGDDGNEMKIGFPTSERDVNCWQKELESHQHRQIYWSRRIK